MSSPGDASALYTVMESIRKAEVELRLAVSYAKSISDEKMKQRARDELLTCELEIEAIIRKAFAP